MMIYQSIITIAIEEPLSDSPRAMQRKKHRGFYVNSDIFELKCAPKDNFSYNC